MKTEIYSTHEARTKFSELLRKVRVARDIMNRAYTYYKEVADVVKEHGQFVFADTPRYAAYVSTYRSDRSKAPRSASAPPPPEETDAAAI